MTQRADGLDLTHLEENKSLVDESPRSGKIIAKGALGRDFYDTPSSGGSKANKSLGQIESSVAKLRIQPTPQAREVNVQTVSVKCNYARDRVEVLAGGELILRFDQNGICKMPLHQMALLEQVQRMRPGRFTVVQEVVVQPPPVVQEEPTEEVPASEEVPVSVQVVDNETLSEKKSTPKPVGKKTKGAVVKSTSDESK